MTDANGDYTFPDLPPGDYQTQVDPAELTGGELDGLDEAPGNIGGNSGTINLAPGETEEADFGYVPDAGTGAVEGTVWSDADGDGIQDPGEVGIPDVTVELPGWTDGNRSRDHHAPAPTAAIFSPVLSGWNMWSTWIRAIRDLAGYTNTTPTTSDPFTVLPDDVVSDVDFGFDSPADTIRFRIGSCMTPMVTGR